ncbi:hypothetical protein APHAL10511_001401 [Amanita phalloides]|nr:hypothetical protein APHAL10511_001401 [Amanita phalloides]
MDPHVVHSFERFRHILKRATIPLVPAPDIPFPQFPGGLPDLNNVQGDVLFRFPKKVENFVFFKITDVPKFKVALKEFLPTPAEEVSQFLHKISDAKGKVTTSVAPGDPPCISKRQWQIAFSRIGINLLGVTEGTGDMRFDANPMMYDKEFLGDHEEWDDPFQKGGLHGVISIAACTPEELMTWTKDAIDLFGSSTTYTTVGGKVRPGMMDGHEHFGFLDGIGQPAPRGVVAPKPGQLEVDPGVVVMGYKGDPALDNPNSTTPRPSWTKDGTMLVFRKLEQDVLLFDWFREQNLDSMKEILRKRRDAPALDDEEVKQLFGARLFGRFPSGAPLALCPYKDNLIIANDKFKRNDFDYVIRNDPNISPYRPSEYYCPFTAHIRKSVPRTLDPFISKAYLESGAIIRSSIPYGDEITEDERKKFDPNQPTPSPRGLLFVCYASSIDEGFIRQNISFSLNDYFPIASLQPVRHGQDPILGSPDFSIDVPESRKKDPFFLTSRGGEYFFVPSVSTLKGWAELPTVMESSVYIFV